MEYHKAFSSLLQQHNTLATLPRSRRELVPGGAVTPVAVRVVSVASVPRGACSAADERRL